MLRLVVACVLLGLILPVSQAADPADTRPIAVARPLNSVDVRRRLGLLDDYATNPRLAAVKVAVLDSGFAGVDGIRPYLPKSVVVVEHYDPLFVRQFGLGDPEYRKPLDPTNAHGRLLAQLVWATTGNSPDGPKFYLLNANGPTLFRRAVRYAIEQKVDVILFAGTFDGAGNYDGRGPINAAVSEAISAGILWINAAGNCGGLVYNGPVVLTSASYLQFAGTPGRTALWFRNRIDEHTVTITLTWNDYREAEDAGTSKDLDLVVEDVAGRLVGKAGLTQVHPGRAAIEGETRNPRERLVLNDLAATPASSVYRVRVRMKAGAFGPNDRVRVLLTPARSAPVADPETGKSVAPVEFVDASRSGEIYPPADHPGVLAVGDSGPASAVGPTADGRVKPDVILDMSTARFSNGEVSDGSSNAAAYFAGVAAAMRAAEPGLTADHLRAWVRHLDRAKPVPTNRRLAFDLPLTPNHESAMRFASWAADDQLARGLPAPGVYVSGPRGFVVVRPGGRVEPLASAPAAMTTRVPHAPWRTPSASVLADLVRQVRK